MCLRNTTKVLSMDIWLQFLYLLYARILKTCKKLTFHDGLLSYQQNRTANLAHLAVLFCCPSWDSWAAIPLVLFIQLNKKLGLRSDPSLDMNVYCTYYRGQYLASICGHWEREAYPLHRIHQGPIAVCSHTNTKKTRKTMIITAYIYIIMHYYWGFIRIH